MWPFSKNTSLERSCLMQGMTDWHSHILPGVDDGVPKLEQSLAILAEYEKLGVKKIWLTPHIMEDMPNTTVSLRQSFKALCDAYGGPIELHLASENMLDNLFDHRLAENDLLPLGEEGRHLLVETSYFNPPMGLYETLENIKSKGYFPVLAHPERYMYMSMDDYDRLKQMGVVLQLNLFSLLGAYGPVAASKARKLLKKGYYSIYGSDLHRLSTLLQFLPLSKLCKKSINRLPENVL